METIINSAITSNPPTGEGLSFEKVWAYLQETARIMKAQSEEAFRELKETASIMKAQSEERFRELKETEQAMKARREEDDRRFREMARGFAETRKFVESIGKQIGDVNNKFGRLSEEMVLPSLARVFNALGFHINDRVSKNIEILDEDSRKLTEIDALLENGESVIAVEIKTSPKEKHIAHHIKRLEILRARMDEKGDTRAIYGAIAGAVFDKQVIAQTVEAGLYPVVQSGDTMRAKAPKGFTPAVW